MRTNTSLIVVMAVLVLAAVTEGFQCSSAALTSAKLYIQRSEWTNARQSLEDELAKNPQNEEAWYLLGRVKAEMKDFAGMNQAFGNALSISNVHEHDIMTTRLSFWAQYFNSGVTHFSKGRDSSEYYDKAIEAFMSAIAINPDSATTYKNLGYACLAKGDDKAAIQPFEEVLKRGNDAQAAKLLGEISYDTGVRHRTAFEAMGNENKDSTEYRAAMGEFNKSIDYLQKASSWDPQDEEIMTVLMNAYIAADRIDEAKEEFRKAAERHPENKFYQYNYGVLLVKEKNYMGAIERFEKAVSVDADYENALYNLGVAYVNWGVEMREAAEAEAQKRGRGVKTSEKYKEKFRAALPHFQRVLDIRPEDAELWEQLGKVYANLNMQAEAKAAFDKADQIRQAK